MNFIDIRTILFILFLEYFLLGVIFILYALRRKPYPGTFSIGLSHILISMSMGLYSIQNIAGPFLTVVTANALLTFGICLTPYGFRQFFEFFNKKLFYYLSLTFIAFFSSYYFTFIINSYVWKVAILWFIFIIIFFETFYVMYSARFEINWFVCIAAGSMYVFLALLHIVKIILVFVSPHLTSPIIISAVTEQQKILTSITLIISVLTSISVFTIFIMMINLRLEIEKQKYAAELEKSDAAKGKFISIISHDLRNPVDGMVSLLGTMTEDKNVPQNIASEIELLKKTSDGLAALLANLLDWAKAQTKNIECRPENISLNEAISETMKILEIRALQKKISVNNEIDGETRVLADRKMLSTMLRNLIYNAIKFTVEAGKISISSASQNGITTIMIRDNGVGMKPEALELIFSLDRSNYFSNGTAGETGTGLGLLICKEFAELNGGTISIASEPGAGTTVTLTLPAPSDAAQA